MPRTVFIVDDHPIVREGYKLLLAHSDLTLAGEAASAEDALEQLTETTADVLIVDIALPGMSGLELVQRLGGRVPTLVVSGQSPAIYRRKALRAGAHGFLDKARASEEIVDALRCILSGSTYFPLYPDVPTIRRATSTRTPRSSASA